jgi:hypothetical protein
MDLCQLSEVDKIIRVLALTDLAFEPGQGLIVCCSPDPTFMAYQKDTLRSKAIMNVAGVAIEASSYLNSSLLELKLKDFRLMVA